MSRPRSASYSRDYPGFNEPADVLIVTHPTKDPPTDADEDGYDAVAYVITQNCCKDASCVPVCPVDCIRPVGGAERFTNTEMLYINPDTCIDCGACMDECPVDAIHYEDDVPDALSRFKDINAAYFERHPLEAGTSGPQRKHKSVAAGRLRVAIVGAGPAACYAANELIAIDGVEVNLFEKLPTPYGLIRAGVAPDHQNTKSIVDIFQQALAAPRMTTHFNVEIGRHLSHDELTAHHHAVVYATGASNSRTLGLPGEDLPGSYAASDFVAWYNGHPDHVGHEFDFSTNRAVIIGNGNVAIDIARILLTDADQLASTDVAQHALDALRDSRIDEVVIIGRRGVRHAAFSVGEFLALGHLDGVDIVIEGDADLDATPNDDVETTAKLTLAREYVHRPAAARGKRIVFRFLASPVEIRGEERVEGLVLVHNRTGDSGGLILGDPETDTTVVSTNLVLRSIGYRGSEIADLPWDPATATVPNIAGRVIDGNRTPVPGVYVTGWIKRGPRGVIGTNRACAEETVMGLLEDFDDGLLDRQIGGRSDLSSILAERRAQPVSWTGWRAIDASERELGAATSRPRLKLVDVDSMIAVATRTPSQPGATPFSSSQEI